MVDLTRRKTVIGLGLLATGSGATFTSAAFNDEVSPGANLQVFVDEELIVQPGSLFRQGGSDGGDFDPTTVGDGPEGTNLYNQSDTDLFGGSSGLEDIDPEDVPAAAINDATDGSIELQVVTGLDAATVGSEDRGLLQVRNETDEDRDIAIRFLDADDGGGFGSDVGQGSEFTKEEVFDIFQFKDGKNNNRISPDKLSNNTQQVPNTVTVPSIDGSGDNVVQIYLDFNPTEANGGKGAFRDAAGFTGEPFTSNETTVQLAESIQVGEEE